MNESEPTPPVRIENKEGTGMRVKFKFLANAVHDDCTAIEIILLDSQGNEIGHTNLDVSDEKIPALPEQDYSFEEAVDPETPVGFLYQEILDLAEENGV